MSSLPSPIIDRPDLQHPGQRTVSGVLTAMFWVLWLILWLPLVTLAGWAFFGYRFHFQMISLDGYVGFLDVLGVYALIIALLGGGLLLWAKYNHLRFRGVERRRGFEAPDTAALAAVHGQAEADLQRWQAQPILTVHHTADGRILRVHT